jgi:hypothetical protein
VSFTNALLFGAIESDPPANPSSAGEQAQGYSRQVGRMHAVHMYQAEGGDRGGREARGHGKRTILPACQGTACLRPTDPRRFSTPTNQARL